MSQVIITLEDNEDGQVTQTVAYTSDKGGFDVNSQAHQYSGIMLKMAGEFAASLQSNTEAAKESLYQNYKASTQPKLVLLS